MYLKVTHQGSWPGIVLSESNGNVSKHDEVADEYRKDVCFTLAIQLIL